MKTIIVTITKGAATVETKGFAGADCLKETADLERALGRKTLDSLTAESRTQTAAKVTQ